MADANTEKKKEDFAETVRISLPKAEEKAKREGLHAALSDLLQIEKRTRLAGEAFPTADVCVKILQICHEYGDLRAVNDNIVLLCKRRSQLSQAIIKLVQEAMSYVDSIQNRDQKVELIETLRTVTEGKIFVEVERARLTRKLSEILDSEGKLSEASEILQEIQVETHGAMEMREKVDFILQQMRLCRAQEDWTRFQIISKKISPKHLEGEDLVDLKIRYFELLSELHTHKEDAWLLSQDYKALYFTDSIRNDPTRRSEVLSCMVLCLVLAPHGPEQSDLLFRSLEDKNLEELQSFKHLVRLFTTKELIRPDFAGSDQVRSHQLFTTSSAKERWGKDMTKRIVQHNLRVLAEYYSKIRFARLTELLHLTSKEAEGYLSEMVSEQMLYARYNRPEGIVRFQRKMPASEVLSNWSNDLSTLLDTVEQTCHLINKEQMIHKR